jgi:preprotein translocase subunit SecA
MEQRGERVMNVTYTAPTETGEAETTPEIGAALAAAATMPPVGRNDPCPCGSGKKYKHCHGALV